LPAEEAGVLAYARAMVHWREKHRFCGRCGSRTVATQGGHVLQCSEAGCATLQFPRIDPAVIVLVTDGERALLGRQADWPAGRYSTIAGFVEPGESLEDAVIREVREETGVEVDVVDYHSSQPWPFPSSLMLGFTAHASRTQIHRADEELEDARWLTREQIAAGEVALPTTHSISFRLIEDWYDAGARVPLRQEPGVRMWRAPKRAVGG
jgi:NAD+ diphosphatase